MAKYNKVILEGCNKVGKTTLSNMLLDNGYKHYIYPRISYEKYLKNALFPNRDVFEAANFTEIASIISSMDAIRNNTVIDRLHLSYAVYGANRHTSTLRDFYKFDEQLRTQNVKLIYLTDSEKNINERNGKNMHKLINLMDDYYSQSKLEKMRVNFRLITESPAEEFLTKEILSFLKMDKK